MWRAGKEGLKFFLPHLSDTHSSPFIFPEKLQGAFGLVMVIRGDHLEHGLGQLHMAIFIFRVRIPTKVRGMVSYGPRNQNQAGGGSGSTVPSRVVDRLDKLFQSSTLAI